MSAEVLSNPFAFDDEPRELLAMSLREYLDHPAPSRSTLWDLWTSSPYEHRWRQTFEPKKETDAMRLGTAVHTAVFEPDLFDTRVICYPGRRAGKAYEEFKAEHDHDDWTILTENQLLIVERVRDYVRSLKGVRRLFTRGLAEQTVIWQDHVTLREVKARPDWIDQDAKRVVDLKTTADLNEWALMKKVRNFGYHLQASLFIDGCAAIGIDIRDVWLLWVRTDGPPVARLTRIPNEAIEEGRTIFREAMDTWHACMESGEWPAPVVKPQDLIWEVAS